METKSWYLSKGVWGAILAGVATVMSIAGFTFDVSGMDNEIVTVIGSALALWGRVAAVAKVTL